jgi:hypothetical protein
MISKQEFLKITIVSAAMMLMLVNIAGAMPFGCGGNNCGVTLITDNCTQSVDLLKFPACGCGGGFPTCGCGENGRGGRGSKVTLITDPCTQSVDLLKFPACGCGENRRGGRGSEVTLITDPSIQSVDLLKLPV